MNFSLFSFFCFKEMLLFRFAIIIILWKQLMWLESKGFGLLVCCFCFSLTVNSKTTHQGDEAAECCAIMSWLAVLAMNNPDLSKDQLLARLPEFPSEFYSIQCLINSRQEERRESNQSSMLEDRNWNWKEENFRYSPTRAKSQPGYVGSYW